MIVQEPITGTNLIKTYSDRGVYIHGGMPESDYEDAIDPADAGRTYVETEVYIGEDITDAEALEIITGEKVGE
jgi:hypothetical protein